MAEDKNFKHLVRIANTDMKGNLMLVNALRNVKGISFMFANAVCNSAAIDKKKKVGYLTDEDIKKVEAVIADPAKFSIPSWMFNRRKDYEDNIDKHLFTADLEFTKDNDIKMMKKIKSYKGVRHAFGLPVRGQRTKSKFRKNKGKVTGVKKKAGAKKK